MEERFAIALEADDGLEARRAGQPLDRQMRPAERRRRARQQLLDPCVGHPSGLPVGVHLAGNRLGLLDPGIEDHGSGPWPRVEAHHRCALRRPRHSMLVVAMPVVM